MGIQKSIQTQKRPLPCIYRCTYVHREAHGSRLTNSGLLFALLGLTSPGDSERPLHMEGGEENSRDRRDENWRSLDSDESFLDRVHHQMFRK